MRRLGVHVVCRDVRVLVVGSRLPILHDLVFARVGAPRRAYAGACGGRCGGLLMPVN
jgi:hypothetical protein